jgi:transcriptional regulator with XRE-family HTH domain
MVQASLIQDARMAYDRRAPKIFAGTAAETPGGKPAPVARSRADSVGVGRRLREIRSSRALSLRALAETSGLNINTLSLIENERTSPSVSTLQQLSQALQVPLTEFFRREDVHLEVVHQRNGSRPHAPLQAGSMEDLAAGMRYPGAEPLILALDRGADSGKSPIVHTGREFAYSLSGCITYTVQGHEYALEPGDSVCFEAYLPHSWRNSGPDPARVLLVLCPMDARDDPKGRHFSGGGGASA